MKQVVIVLWACCAVVACRGDRDRAPAPTEPTGSAPAPSAPASACATPGGRVCVGDQAVACLASGELGAPIERCPGGCRGGACVETCGVKDVELVYVVDASATLWSFDPRKLPGDPFHRIGPLTCEPTRTPFSMAVDRRGIAWVMYHGGALHRVSIFDARCIGRDVPASAPQLFGMGFVSAGPGSEDEQLYVAAYEAPAFGVLDLATLRWTQLGEIAGTHPQSPELTGTGDGKLFGYFPEDGRGYIQQLDRATGALVGEPLRVATPPGRVGGWAFAHWGGVFYVFVTIDGNSAVYAVHGTTGKSELVRAQLPSRIVGAGVSTCAPLLEQAPQ